MNKVSQSPRCLYLLLICFLLYGGWFVAFASMQEETPVDDGFPPEDNDVRSDYPLKALLSALNPSPPPPRRTPPRRCGLVFPNASELEAMNSVKPLERIPIIYARYNASARGKKNPSLNYEWLSSLDSEKYEVIKYEMSDEPCLDANDRFCIHPNRGNEVPSYLKYIIDHYSRLPEYAIFIHGHRTSWHSYDKTRLLQMVSIEVLRDNAVEFFNFRNMTPNSEKKCVPREWKDEMRPCMAEGWEKVYKSHDAFPVAPPARWTIYCCAEFIVSRAAILRRPRQFYENALFWLWNTTWEQTFTSRFFEFSWHMIFTKRMDVDQCKAYIDKPTREPITLPSVEELRKITT